MDATIIILGVAIVHIVFPLIAAVIAFKRGRVGWGIATLASIFLAMGWLVGIFALRQRAKSRSATALALQNQEMSCSGSSPDGGAETSCENCGARTSLGATYGFVQAYKTKGSANIGRGDVHVSPTLSQTPYTLAESTGVFLCNKCVLLYRRRKTRVVFRNALIIILALLAISIPISLLMKNLFFVTPTMVLIFAGPLAIYHSQILKIKEQAPLRAYRDLCNNPEYPNPKGRSDPLLQQVVLLAGETLAIRLKAPSLAKSGVDALFTHEEAKKLKSIMPGKINLDKQKRDGLKNLLIGGGLGIVTFIMVWILPWEGPGGVIGMLGGAICLSYLGFGFGILTSGNPGGTLISSLRWLCPYCEHKLADDDLPTPGYFAACPKCGRMFGRKGWSS